MQEALLVAVDEPKLGQLRPVAGQPGLTRPGLPDVEAEASLDVEADARGVHRLIVGPAVLALDQQELGEQHGTPRRGAGALVRRKVSSSDQQVAEGLEQAVERVGRVRLGHHRPHGEEGALPAVGQARARSAPRPPIDIGSVAIGGWLRGHPSASWGAARRVR